MGGLMRSFQSLGFQHPGGLLGGPWHGQPRHQPLPPVRAYLMKRCAPRCSCFTLRQESQPSVLPPP